MAACTLPAMLAAAAAEHGEHVAVRGPHGPTDHVSYAELNRRAGVLHDSLASHVVPGDFVLIGGHNSIEWIVAIEGW